MCSIVDSLVIGLDDGVGGSVQLLSTLEERQLYDEQVFKRLPATLGDELSGSLCRAACGE